MLDSSVKLHCGCGRAVPSAAKHDTRRALQP